MEKEIVADVKAEEVKQDETAGKTNEEVKETPSESLPEQKPEKEKPSQEGENTQAEKETPFHKRWAKQKEKLREELNSEWSKKFDELKQSYQTKPSEPADEVSSIPKWFREAFGENVDLWKEYKADSEEQRKITKQEAIKEYIESQEKEKQEIQKWNKVFEEQMEELRDEGKSFKDDELRDVVARYSPVDENGVYDFRKAYEILQMEKQYKASSNSQARKQIASMTAPTKATFQKPGFVANKVGDYSKMSVEEYMKQNGLSQN